MKTFIVVGDRSSYIQEASLVTLHDYENKSEADVKNARDHALANFIKHDPRATRVVVYEFDGEPKTFECRPAFSEVKKP